MYKIVHSDIIIGNLLIELAKRDIYDISAENLFNYNKKLSQKIYGSNY